MRSRLTDAGFDIRVLGRCNALLGLAEIPRELAAARHESGYHGILSKPNRAVGIAQRVKRGWLRLEGRALAAGLSLPLGRTPFALCKKR